MSKLKYRVWDKDREEMTYPEDLESNYTEPTQNGGLGYFMLTQNGNVLCNDGILIDDWHDSYETMLSTGLFDKLNTEIYEFDIMSLTPDGTPTAMIVFNVFGGFEFEWIDPVFKRVRGKKSEPIFHNISLFKVIGNKYISE